MAKKRKVGRPRKLETAADKARFLRVLKQCCGLRTAACRKLGIVLNTLSAAEARDPGFKAAVNDASEDVLDRIHVNTLDAALTDHTLGLRVLKCKRPDEWSEKQRVSHEGTVGITIVEDPDWYGNNAHAADSESPSASDSSPDELGEDEAPGLR